MSFIPSLSFFLCRSCMIHLRLNKFIAGVFSFLLKLFFIRPHKLMHNQTLERNNQSCVGLSAHIWTDCCTFYNWRLFLWGDSAHNGSFEPILIPKYNRGMIFYSTTSSRYIFCKRVHCTCCILEGLSRHLYKFGKRSGCQLAVLSTSQALLSSQESFCFPVQSVW